LFEHTASEQSTIRIAPISQIQKDTREELEAKNTGTIDFDSKTPASTTPAKLNGP